MLTQEELEMIVDYIVTHTSEDWPLDQSTDEFMNKVKKWKELNDETIK